MMHFNDPRPPIGERSLPVKNFKNILRSVSSMPFLTMSHSHCFF